MIKVLDEDIIRINKIYPNKININENKNYRINLSCSNNFEEEEEMPIGVTLVEKKTNKTINKIFDLYVEDNIISFDITYDFLSTTNYSGYYYIKILFDDEETNIISTDTIFLTDRLTLYSKKQIIAASSNINQIGVIFTNELYMIMFHLVIL